MFPLRDNIPSSRYPVVNSAIILLNVVSFLYELQLGSGLEGFIRTYGFVPARFLTQLDTGALSASMLPVFTAMFLHGGFLHLLSNMWILWIFGDNVEDSMGHARYLLYYLLCGLGSIMAQAAFVPDSALPLVGASWAIAGVLGGYFILYPRARVVALLPIFIFFYLVDLPAYVFLGLWLGLQFLSGYAEFVAGGEAVRGGVAWWAHVGGFLSGLVLVWIFAENRFLRRRSGG